MQSPASPPAAASSRTCFPASAPTPAPAFAACELNRAAVIKNEIVTLSAGTTQESTGAHQDAVCNIGSGGFHCNAHANNLVLVPPGAIPPGAPGAQRLVCGMRVLCELTACLTLAAGCCAGLGHGFRRTGLHSRHERKCFWRQREGETLCRSSQLCRVFMCFRRIRCF